MTPYFCWLSLLSPKDPTCELFDRSHPKTSIFCIRLPLEATICFNFINKLNYFFYTWQIDHFCLFRRFFFQIPAFKALTERSEVTFSPNAPYWTKIWLLTQWPLIFWDCVLCPRAQPLEVWALHPYPFDNGVLPPPPPRACSSIKGWTKKLISYISDRLPHIFGRWMKNMLVWWTWHVLQLTYSMGSFK